LADALAAAMTPHARILLARAAGARDVLPDRLREAGGRVDVLELYRAVPPAGLGQRLAENLDRVDMITFTSSSTVAHFADAIDRPLPGRVAIACIGPITAQTARDRGMRVDIIAQEYTTRGLVEAIARCGSCATPSGATHCSSPISASASTRTMATAASSMGNGSTTTAPSRSTSGSPPPRQRPAPT